MQICLCILIIDNLLEYLDILQMTFDHSWMNRWFDASKRIIDEYKIGVENSSNLLLREWMIQMVG